MNESKKNKNIFSTILIIVMLIVLVVVYRKYDFNFFSKGVTELGKTSFSRDNNEKYSKQRSYKIENEDYTDSMFYRKISVNRNSAYKVTCMVKTENVEQYEEDSVAGAQIILKDTEEHSEVIKGTTDWQKVEFFFNSKDNDTVEIGFVLGGVNGRAKGTAWFSDLKIEQGYQPSDTTWNFVCFIFDNVNVKLDDGIQVSEKINTTELSAINKSFRMFESTLSTLSKNKINANCTMIEINEPITSLSYDEQNGYYIGEKDVYTQIKQYVKENEYDHIFVCAKLPDQAEMNNPDATNWIGLGNMEFCGKGFSDIRILNDGVNFEYSAYSDFPQEVFLHEFLHTLERNSKEYGYEIPALHDNEQYGYKDDRHIRLKKWYVDYMNKEIKSANGSFVGLPEEIFKYKPVNSSNFKHSLELDYLDAPKNIIETINCTIVQVQNLFNKQEDEVIYLQIVSD